MNESTNTTQSENVPNGIQPLISGTATPYHSVYMGTAGFLCYLSGAVFTLSISVFLIIFMIAQSHPWGVRLVMLFILTGALLMCIVAVLRVIKIANNRPTREQQRALEIGQVTNARIVSLDKTRKRMRSKDPGTFYTVFYNIKYEYTNATGNQHSGQYQLDVNELFDPHFTEGGSIAVAFIDGDSIPVESYRIAKIDDKDKIDDARLHVPPTVKGKLRPIDSSARHNRLGWICTVVASGMYFLAIAATLLLALGRSSQDTMGKIYFAILICGTEGGIGIIPIGYAVKYFKSAHNQRAKFKRLLSCGTLSYASVKYTGSATLYDRFSIYAYPNGDDLACGAIESRKLYSEIANLLVGYLTPPYLKILVLFSDTESLPVYEK